jgi:hypothetical protein
VDQLSKTTLLPNEDGIYFAKTTLLLNEDGIYFAGGGEGESEIFERMEII